VGYFRDSPECYASLKEVPVKDATCVPGTDPRLVKGAGWDLLAPPPTENPYRPDRGDLKAPLEQWIIVTSRDSLEDCQQAREQELANAEANPNRPQIAAAIKAEQCVASDDPRRPRMVAKLRPRRGEKLRLAKGWYFLLPPLNDNFQIMRGAPLAQWKNQNITHPYSSVEGCEQFRHLAAAVQANLAGCGKTNVSQSII
jgi:hypothetical protein